MTKIFKHFGRVEWLLFAAMGLLLIGQCYFDLTIPEYTGKIINLITPHQDASGSVVMLTSTGELWKNGGIMLAYCAASIGLLMAAGYFSSILGARVGKNLRQKVFYKVESFSLEEMGRFSPASLITRTTNDVQQITMSITMGFRFMVKAPIMAVMATLKASSLSGSLSFVTASAVVLLVLFVLAMLMFVMPKFKKVQKTIDKLNSVTRENLTGLRVVRAYNAEDYQEEKFEKANTELTKTYLFVNRANSLMDPFLTFIMNATSLATYWLGSYLLSKGEINSVGVITEFYMYSTQIITSFIFLVAIFLMLPRAAVSARRIDEVLSTPLRILDGQGATPDRKGEVEFKNVCFRYPDAEENVLDDISFSVSKGETVAFIGSTGSGKSTLIKLIPRFFDCTGGEVTVGGVNVRDYTTRQLRDMIGYVPQKGVLFSGDIKDNIVYGETTATEDDMKNAARTAKAEEFILQKHEQYDAPISQGGTNVSGGQKQRLSIARALVKNPDILVFDDSFSALDYKTDKELRAALKASMDSTCLIVAQRIGTIIGADKIVVLDKGRVAGIDTHKNLLKNCEVYREIAYSQLSKEELE